MNIAIILSAGSSTRMNRETPKQFLEVGGKKIISYSLDTFYFHKMIDAIAIVIREEDRDFFEKLIKNKNGKPIYLINGGTTRSESSYNALRFLKNYTKEDDIILIHDAARPLVSERIINENIKKVSMHKAILTYLPMTDSVFIKNNEKFEESFSRDKLGIAQTPQTFLFKDIYDAYSNIKNLKMATYTDDIQVFKKLYTDVELVIGERKNMKITTSEDFEILRSLLIKSLEDQT